MSIISRASGSLAGLSLVFNSLAFAAPSAGLDKRLVVQPTARPWNLIGQVLPGTDPNLVRTGTLVGKHLVVTSAESVYNAVDPKKRGTLKSEDLWFVPPVAGADGKLQPVRVVAILPGTTFNAKVDRAKGRIPANMKEVPVESEFNWAILVLEHDLGSYFGTAEVSRKNAEDFDRKIPYSTGVDFGGGKTLAEATLKYDSCYVPEGQEGIASDKGAVSLVTMKTTCLTNQAGLGGPDMVIDIPEEESEKQPTLFALHVAVNRPKTIKDALTEFDPKTAYTFSVKALAFHDALMTVREVESDEANPWKNGLTYEQACSGFTESCPLEPVGGQGDRPALETITTTSSYVVSDASPAKVRVPAAPSAVSAAPASSAPPVQSLTPADELKQAVEEEWRQMHPGAEPTPTADPAIPAAPADTAPPALLSTEPLPPQGRAKSHAQEQSLENCYDDQVGGCPQGGTKSLGTLPAKRP